MDVQILGNPDYGELSVKLDPGETISIEGGAMSRMASTLEMRSRMMGGFLSAHEAAYVDERCPGQRAREPQWKGSCSGSDSMVAPESSSRGSSRGDGAR